VASAAGFGFLHFGHGVVTACPEIEECIVAYFAVVVVLIEVGCMAEDDGSCIPEAETDIIYVSRNSIGCHQKKNHYGQDGNSFCHFCAPL